MPLHTPSLPFPQGTNMLTSRCAKSRRTGAPPWVRNGRERVKVRETRIRCLRGRYYPSVASDVASFSQAHRDEHRAEAPLSLRPDGFEGWQRKQNPIRRKIYFHAEAGKLACAGQKISVRTKINFRAEENIFSCAQKFICFRKKICLT